MSDQQFEVIVTMLNSILEELQELNERFAKYDSEEQINDEMLRDSGHG